MGFCQRRHCHGDEFSCIGADAPKLRMRHEEQVISGILVPLSRVLEAHIVSGASELNHFMQKDSCNKAEGGIAYPDMNYGLPFVFWDYREAPSSKLCISDKSNVMIAAAEFSDLYLGDVFD